MNRKNVTKVFKLSIYSVLSISFVTACCTKNSKAFNPSIISCKFSLETNANELDELSCFGEINNLGLGKEVDLAGFKIEDYFEVKREEDKIEEHDSTMELMITGEEKAKEDIELEKQIEEERKRLEAEKKKKAAERKRKEAEKKKKEAERKRKEAEKKKNAFSASSEEISMLEHLCNGEAGNQSDECQQAVISVVLNRVNSKWYPGTIKKVIFQRGQYACTWDGNYDKKPSKKVKKNVQAVLKGEGINVPKNVVYQAQFKQGKGVWKTIGTEIFCYK